MRLRELRPRKTSLSKARLRCRNLRARNRASSLNWRIPLLRLVREVKIPLRKTPKFRCGPRPSQRPSRASWQFTNFPHFLSKSGPRPLPFPLRCPNAVAGRAMARARLNKIMNKTFRLAVKTLIKPPSELVLNNKLFFIRWSERRISNSRRQTNNQRARADSP
jgi:hypothetical protein